MNERIRQLADEAGLRFTQLMSNPMVPVVDGKETDLEKFAELLFNEVANTAVIYDGYIDESRQLAVKLHLGDFKKRIPIIGD